MKNTFNLKNSADFQNILKKGTWNPGDFMSLYLMKNGNDFNMMGIAVGKKFSKSSVKRNRVKRLIREAYRSSESRVKKGYSFVFLWKNDVDYSNVTYESAGLSSSVKKEFEKIAGLKSVPKQYDICFWNSIGYN